jgi:hypothetical protein
MLRSQRRARDNADRLHCGIRCQPPGLDIFDRSHRRSYAIHVHAGRIRRDLEDENAVLAIGLELQFAPARHDVRAQAQRATKTLRRRYSLVGGLSVDE